MKNESLSADAAVSHAVTNAILADQTAALYPISAITAEEVCHAAPAPTVGNQAYLLSQKLDDLPLTARADFGAIGFLGGTVDLAPDDTDALQRMFTTAYRNLRVSQIPGGYFATGPLYFGDPATRGILSETGQAQLANVRGEGRGLSAFFAKPGLYAADLPVISANNAAGMSYRDFSVYAEGQCSTAVDFSWVNPAGLAAPSNQCEYRNIYVGGATVLGINFGACHDSTIENVSVSGSPIGVRVVGGGGQLNMVNCNIAGVTQICAQNLAMTSCVMLGGIDVNGNSDNAFTLAGTQVFPIAASDVVPAEKFGYGIHAGDAGTYGCSFIMDTATVFGFNHCITGKFNTFGIMARNTVFNYGPQGELLHDIVAGNAPVKPLFKFESCRFPGNGTPLGTNPENYHWEMINCFVGGVFIQYASNSNSISHSSEGSWTPVVDFAPLADGKHLVINFPAKWFRTGNLGQAFCDVTWPINADTSPAYIKGLFKSLAGAGSAVNVNFNSSTYALGGYVSGDTVVLVKDGYPNATPTNAELSNCRLMLHITWSLSAPTAGV